MSLVVGLLFDLTMPTADTAATKIAAAATASFTPCLRIKRRRFTVLCRCAIKAVRFSSNSFFAFAAASVLPYVLAAVKSSVKSGGKKAGTFADAAAAPALCEGRALCKPPFVCRGVPAHNAPSIVRSSAFVLSFSAAIR